MATNRPLRKLTNVKLDEISFVSRGDNPDANVLLLKMKPEETSNQKGEGTMTPEEIAALKKAKDDADAQVANLTKSVTDITKENETLKAMSAEDKKKMDAMIAEKDKMKKEEDVLKGLPEYIQKELTANRERISKMEDDNLTREYVTKAADAPLVGKADEVGSLLKSIAKSDPAAADKVLALLKTANERIKEGDLLKEKGKGEVDGEAASAYDKIVAKAADLRKTCPELTVAQAFSKVYDAETDLRKEYEAERK